MAFLRVLSNPFLEATFGQGESLIFLVSGWSRYTSPDGAPVPSLCVLQVAQVEKRLGLGGAESWSSVCVD